MIYFSKLITEAVLNYSIYVRVTDYIVTGVLLSCLIAAPLYLRDQSKKDKENKKEVK